MQLADLLKRDIDWRKHGKAVLRYGVAALAVLYALQMGWVRPLGRYRGIAESKSTGLGAVTEYPQYQPEAQYYAASFAEPESPPEEPAQPSDRKMVRNARFSLSVTNPQDAAGQVEQIAQQFGGYVVKTEARGSGEDRTATMEIRVPAARYEQVRGMLRGLAVQVTSEESSSDDVTRQYVDSTASLRSFRAEEAQYLTILKRAASVKEVLDVTDKLNAVRRDIEKTQAEVTSLTQQVQMCLITVNLYRQTEFRTFAIDWRPGSEIKFAARSGIESLAAYVNSMMTFALHLPSILLWVATVLGGAALSWRGLKWALRLTFGRKEAHS